MTEHLLPEHSPPAPGVRSTCLGRVRRYDGGTGLSTGPSGVSSIVYLTEWSPTDSRADRPAHSADIPRTADRHTRASHRWRRRRARVHRLRRDRAGKDAIDEDERLVAQRPAHAVVTGQTGDQRHAPAALVGEEEPPALGDEGVVLGGFGGTLALRAAGIGIAVDRGAVGWPCQACSTMRGRRRARLCPAPRQAMGSTGTG